MNWPFLVKDHSLCFDEVRGFGALHQDAKRLLQWLCAMTRMRHMAPPLVTCFGRDRDDQEAIYGAEGRNKYSRHCVDSTSRKCHAFDVRTIGAYSEEEIQTILEATKRAHPNVTAIYHTGTAPHLHFQVNGPRPTDWL